MPWDCVVTTKRMSFSLTVTHTGTPFSAFALRGGRVRAPGRPGPAFHLSTFKFRPSGASPFALNSHRRPAPPADRTGATRTLTQEQHEQHPRVSLASLARQCVLTTRSFLYPGAPRARHRRRTAVPHNSTGSRSCPVSHSRHHARHAARRTAHTPAGPCGAPARRQSARDERARCGARPGRVSLIARLAASADCDSCSACVPPCGVRHARCQPWGNDKEQRGPRNPNPRTSAQGGEREREREREREPLHCQNQNVGQGHQN